MNINSSAYYSVSSSNSASKGISGLASGMDTDSMVEQMLSGTQSKIDKQEALKQQTLWKQEIYRDVIGSINGFYAKYFDTSYGSGLANNFASASFFNSMLSSVKSGDAVKIVSTGTDAAVGDVRVAVKQLATNAKLVSDRQMSGDQKILGATLQDEELNKLFDKQVSLRVGDRDIDVNLNHVDTESGMVDALNQALQNAGVTNVTAKIYNNRLRFVSDDPATRVELGENSTELGLKMTGLTSLFPSGLQDGGGQHVGNMLQGTQVQADVGYSFQLTLDGVQKSVTLRNVADEAGNITAETVHKAFQQEVERTFGDYIQVDLDDDGAGGKRLMLSLNFRDGAGQPELGHELTVTGLDASKIGLRPGASTHINSGTTLGELGLGGERFRFTVNGRQFSFDSDASLGSVMNTINNSDAGVRLTYSGLSDTFKMEATSTGAKYGIQLSQQEGDLLSKLFGSDVVRSASSVASSRLTVGEIAGRPGGLEDGYRTTSASLKLNVNGKDYTFTLPKKKDVVYSKDVIEAGFNAWLAESFGTTGEGDAEQANLSYENGVLHAADGFVVQFTATKVDVENPKAVAEAAQTDLALAFGFNTTAQSNIAAAGTPLDRVLQLRDLDASRILNADGAPATTLEDVRSIDGLDVRFDQGRLTLSGSGTVDLSGKPELAALFGATGFTLSDGGAVDGAVTAGQDAELILNGVTTTRSSNTVTIDGITMELTKQSAEVLDGSGNVTGYEETVIGTSRDVDKLVKGFQSFVEDYNAMLDKLNGYVDEEANYRKYAPLTAAQKKEMSDKEVELWEEKAKQGLVRRDDTIDNFLSQMRVALYTKPEGSKYALFDIGIETKQYKDKGKLQLDEAALRNAIAADPDAVRNLFTDATEGLAKKLMDAMDGAAKESSGTPGTLVQLAGVQGGALEKSNSLYEKLTSIESRIKDLKTKYEAERTRYWNQFTAMERILSNYNSQSMMISQQFSGY